jgi:glutamine synthetase
MPQPDNRTWMDELPAAFKRYLAGRRLDEVECIVPDLNGMSRGKAMPLSKFSPDSPVFLPISIFYQTITGQDVEMDIENQWAESDMALVPDLSTAMAVPWAKLPSLQIIHDLQDLQGRPISCAPRNVLKHVIGLYRAKGWVPIVAPELEFYLTKPNIDPNEPIEPPVGRSGRSGTSLQSYSMSAIDEYGPVIETIYEYAEAAGLHIDSVIQEDGAGQVEFNLTHGDPLLLADQVFYFKRIIKEAALKNGIFATFMAKPMRDQPGSAMHLHQSVVDAVTGRNIFSDTEGAATELFGHFIGGTQQYLRDVMPLIAPNVNSYRRFESEANSSAPTNIGWGYDNRATGLRVPHSGAQDRRLENRVIGVDANPYLAIAASLVCGYLGMVNRIAADAPAASELDDEQAASSYIPMTFDEALRTFDRAGAIHQALGTEFCRLYAAVKKEEMRLFHREISPWERQHLLLNV